MINQTVQFIDFKFDSGVDLIRENRTADSFTEVFKAQVEESAIADKKANSPGSLDKAKKKKMLSQNGLQDISKIVERGHREQVNGIHKTYEILEKIKHRREKEEEVVDKTRKNLEHSPNVVGHPLILPVNNDSGRKASKTNMLAVWEKFAPSVSEDAPKRSVRVDIPLLNDVRSLILKMNPDRSISASILGSEAMAELIKQNKDKLDKNFRHHNLTLREFNTYRSELEFNTETESKKKKNKKGNKKSSSVDIF